MSVNLVLLCGIIVAIIVLLGRTNAAEIRLKVHEAAGDVEDAAILRRRSPSSARVRNGPQEHYGTFADSQNGQ